MDDIKDLDITAAPEVETEAPAPVPSVEEPVDLELFEKKVKLSIVKTLLDSVYPSEELTQELLEIKESIFEQIDGILTTQTEINVESEDLIPEEEKEVSDNKIINAGSAEFEIQNQVGGESIENIKAKLGVKSAADEAIVENKYDRLFKFNLNNLAKSADLYFEGLVTVDKVLQNAAKITNRWDYKDLFDAKEDPDKFKEELIRVITYLKGKLGSITKI